jgi:hypothetical protein
MELDLVLKSLRRHRLAVVLIVMTSAIVGFWSAYRLLGFPPALEARYPPRGQADQQVLIDAPSPVVTDTKADIDPLTVRTPAFAQVMRSSALRHRVAVVTGIPEQEITTEGPWTGPAAGQNNDVPAEARGMQIAGEASPYKLSFVPRVNLPVITIHAEAPSRADAAVLAHGATVAIQDFTSQLYDALENKPRHGIVVRPVGEPSTMETGGRTGQLKALLVMATGVLLGLLVLVSADEMRRRLRRTPDHHTTMPEMTA